MTDTKSTSTAEKSPDKEAIRSQLEATRKAYHELLNSLSPEEWKKKTPNESWRVGQLMWHMAWSLGLFPRGVERCRKGARFSPPLWIVHPANMLITRIGSRGTTKAGVAQKYDANHTSLVACLEGVQANEWQKSTRGLFGQYLTVEQMFGIPAEHLVEHKREIEGGLGRSSARHQ